MLQTTHTDQCDLKIADEQLVQRADLGDRGAFNILTDRYIRLVYGIGWSITGRREDADDVVQDTLLSAYSRIHSLKDGRRFSAWIGQIARNTALDVLARRKRHRIEMSWLKERDLIDTPVGNLDVVNRLNHLWIA
jgi:RNA polymerase sigma-70 factor (ECF subfamily)